MRAAILWRALRIFSAGELKGYTQLLEESRQEAIDRMVRAAEKSGANAIVNIRLATSSVTVGAAEVFAYGTAVKIEKVRQ